MMLKDNKTMTEIEEVRSWREEARHYAENADFWRANYEAQKAENARLREILHFYAFGLRRTEIVDNWSAPRAALQETK